VSHDSMSLGRYRFASGLNPALLRGGRAGAVVHRSVHQNWPVRPSHPMPAVRLVAPQGRPLAV